MDIDIIEPYPEEILLSWFIRMAQWYGYNSLSIKAMRNFKNMLLSSSSKLLFNLYVPEFLDYLVKIINLPDSRYFKSYITIIEKMTVFPFYSVFIDQDIKSKYYNIFKDATSIRNTECSFHIRESNNYYEESLQIKICPLCIREKGTFYLDREHQVQNNYICYKHKSVLLSIKWDRYRCLIIRNLDCNGHVKCIEDNDKYFDIRNKIALAIHEIFNDKIQDSIDVIKAKMRKKLKMLNYIDENNIFIDINKFWIDFYEYNVLSIGDKQLLRILFTTTRGITPIAYLSLILFLFQTIDDFSNFKISASESKKIYRYKDSVSALYKTFTNVKMTRNDLNSKLSNNEFEVMQKIDYYHVVIRHKICNHTWPLHKSSLGGNLKCPKCTISRRYSKYKNLVEELAGGDKYEFVQMDPEDQSRIIVLHKECNAPSSYTIVNFKNGQRCTQCKIINSFKKRIYDLVDNEYLLLKYEGSNKRATYLHNDPNCMGRIYFYPGNFLKLRHCSECGKEKRHIPKSKSR